MADNLLRVQPIRNGTVIDHIKPGRGKKILDVLELSNSGTTISLLINVASKKKKRKDIIKVETHKLLEKFKNFPGYIFNLGHGLTPDICPNKVKYLTELVRDY